MEFMGIGQVAVFVEDLDSAMKDYTDVFGINFEIVEADFINMRVAVSDGGVVLAANADGEETPESQAVKRNWNGGLTAVELRVDDIEEARELLEARGCRMIYRMDDDKTGFREYYVTQFHGMPVTVFQMD